MQDSEEQINKNDTKTISFTKIEDNKPKKLDFIEYLLIMPKCDN
ncbi:MAG: hypothetical protein ACIPMY_02460 [Rickettsia endosymbiont of Pentastiridius leporinus]